MTVEKTIGYHLNFDESLKSREDLVELEVIEKTKDRLVYYLMLDGGRLFGLRDYLCEVKREGDGFSNRTIKREKVYSLK